VDVDARTVILLFVLFVLVMSAVVYFASR